MDVERLNKIEAIFHAAVDLAPEAREDFLRQECGDDDELRREIQSLLDSDRADSGLISGSADSLIRSALSGGESDAAKNESSYIGADVNQYKILSVIGEGGMGKVYLAHDERLERKVAIKFLPEQFANDRIRRERFFREAKSASALNHPNILTVHEIGEFNDSFFIVTEFVRGETLKSRLKTERLSIDTAIDIATQITSALSAAHQAGIVHRDVKPDNVMIRDDKLVKVLDFGIAKLDQVIPSGDDSEAETKLDAATMPGMIIGTPQYMSPEQARGQKVDARSDIFSIGVVLYEMLAGTPPFKGATNIDLLGAILKDEPQPISELVPDIPAELERIVEKSIRKDRDQRYQTTRDMLVDLTDIRRSIELSMASRSGTFPGSGRVTSEEAAPRRSRTFLGSAAALIAIAGIVAAAYVFLGGRPSASVSDLRTVEVANWSSSPGGEVYSVGSFSPDAKTIAFSSTRGGSANIWVKQTTGGEAVQITKDDGGNKNPVWSPTGDEIAFFSTRGGQAGIWRIPRLGGSPQLIVEVADRAILLRAWTKSDKIYFESRGELYSIPSAGGKPEQVTKFQENSIAARTVQIAADESQIAYTANADGKNSIWLTDTNGRKPTKLFETTEQVKNLVWHSDATRLFFSSTVDYSFQIFVTDTFGSAPQQLTSTDADCLVLDVAPAGDKVLFGTAKEESDLRSVTLADRKESDFATSIDSDLWPDVSPDGKSVAYQSVKRLSQGNRIFDGRVLVKPASGGETETQIAPAGSVPRFSPNGRQIAFFERQGTSLRLKVVNSGGGEARDISAGPVPMFMNGVLPYNRMQSSEYSWSPDSSKIAHVTSTDNRLNIGVTNADGSANVPLTAFTEDLTISSPVWSPDGKRVVFLTQTKNLEGQPTFSIVSADVESKTTDPLFSGKSFIRLIGWSSDARELLIATVARGALSGAATSVQISRIDLATRAAKEMTTLENAYLHNIHLSPDRKLIAFAGHREGYDNLWTLPAAGGDEKQITNNTDSRFYFSTLAWSPDSGKIFYGRQSRFSLLSMLNNFK